MHAVGSFGADGHREVPVRLLGAVLFFLLAAACGAGPSSPADASVTGADAGAGGADAGGGASGGDAGGAALDFCAEVLADRAMETRGLHGLLLGCLQSEADVETKGRAIDRFIAFVDARGGFPIIEGDTVLFFYVRAARWDPRVGSHSEDLTVAGEFNGWTQVPMTHQGEGVMEAELTLPGWSASGGRYKFVSGGQNWFADPLSRRFAYDENGEISLLKPLPGEARFDRYVSVSAARLGNRRTVYVWTPSGYETSTEPHDVLYMHDGQNLFDPSMPRSSPEVWDVDRIAAEEMAAGRVRPMIVVGVTSTEQRFDEYTFSTDMADGATVGGRGADYEAFLLEELKPMISANYRVSSEAKRTAVLGSSLGGLVSYELALRHPETFGCAGGMSSTFGWGRGAGQETVLDRYAASTTLSGSGLRFYLDSGGNANCPTTGTDNVCETYEMKSILESKGFTAYPADPSAERLDPSTNILHWYEMGGTHKESTWGGRLFRFLRFCFAP
jgi:predicted alpha/beta superfamily hydrolase